MTKTELEDFVKEVYATYNQTLFEKDRPLILKAWWALLRDLDVEVVRAEFLNMSVIYTRSMPTPGAVRRSVLDAGVVDGPPSAEEAWILVQELMRGVNQGTFVVGAVQHVTVAETLRRLGDVAYGLVTNGDREFFMNVYNSQLDLYKRELYRVVV